MTDYTPIINLVAKLLEAILIVAVIPFLKEKYGTERIKKLYSYAEIFVGCAEQIYTAVEPETKKSYVLDLLRGIGGNYTEDELNSAVENAVLKLHNEIYKD